MDELNLPKWVYGLYGTIAAFSAGTDYWTGKIYNYLTLPSILLGFLLVSFYFGISGLWASLLGVGLVLLLFYPLFFLKTVGAGDVKLLMALATILSLSRTLEMIYACVVVGGIGAACLLIKHKRVKIFFKELGRFFKTLFYPGLSVEWPRLSKEIKAPFGIAVFVGYLWAIL